MELRLCVWGLALISALAMFGIKCSKLSFWNFSSVKEDGIAAVLNTTSGRHRNITKRSLSKADMMEVPYIRRSRRDLRKMLGPVFNSSYMSIKKPFDFHQNETWEKETFDSISVTASQNPLDTKDSNSTHRRTSSRSKREIRNSRTRSLLQDIFKGVTPWTCPWYVKWIDMGEDSFPRYMRTVTCSTESCWFDQFSCQPRSFVVVVLRRKTSKYTANAEEIDKYFPKKRRTGDSKLPKELREAWEFEEREANFYCECVMPQPK